MAVDSRHNKYSSIPDWFGTQSLATASQTATVTSTSSVKYTPILGGNNPAFDVADIPIDNSTIVWNSELLLSVPIDNDTITITDGLLKVNFESEPSTGLWELRTLDDGTLYIYGSLPVVTQYGITMYAGDGTVDLPSIYEGLPIDNKTIKWNDAGNLYVPIDGKTIVVENGVLTVVGGTGGGVADEVAWANVKGKPTWLTDDVISYTEVNGLETALLDYVTETELSETLKGYVTIDDTYQSITGIKNFIGGIEINGLSITNSQDDVVYIDANLVVRGGITMYAGGTIDIPSIIESLPPASYKEPGIASFDLVYFTVVDGYVTLNEDSVGLNTEELALQLETWGYATKNWVTEKGYATLSSVTTLSNTLDTYIVTTDKSIESILTTLDDKADKSALEAYVTRAGDEDITGIHPFINGLKIGTSLIEQSQDGVLYIDGNLVVKGGITMYGTDSTDVTDILENLPIAGTTKDALGIAAFDPSQFSVDGGYVTFIGSASGVDETFLANYLTTNEYAVKSDIPTSIKSPYKLTMGSKTYDGSAAITLTASDLGALTAHQTIYALTINNSAGSAQVTYTPNSKAASLTLTKAMVGLGNVENTALSTWAGSSKITTLGTITSGTWNGSKIANDYLANSAISISGTSVSLGGSITQAALRTALGLGSNAYTSTAYLPSASYTAADVLAKLKTVDGSGSGLDADLLDGYNSSSFYRNYVANVDVSNIGNFIQRDIGNIIVDRSGFTALLINFAAWNRSSVSSLELYVPSYEFVTYGLQARISVDSNRYTSWRTFAFTDSNVASATKLQTARTIWGQSFDGTENVTNDFYLPNGKNIYAYDTSGNARSAVYMSPSNNLSIGFETSLVGSTYIEGRSIFLRTSDSETLNARMVITNEGYVGIGTINPDSKLHVIGDSQFVGNIGIGQTDGTGKGISLYSNPSFVESFGIMFATSANFGTLGDKAVGDWFTYFTMDGSTDRGWMFRHKSNGNVAAISADGDFTSTAWYRTKGNGGWYSIDYEGGWNMIDKDLIRDFGGKILYLGQHSGPTYPNYNTYGIGGHDLFMLIGGTARHASILLRSSAACWGIAANANKNMYIGFRNSILHNQTSTDVYTLMLSGQNMLCYGGITMYSDIRKKTKLRDVVLSLKEVADAPLIEHYYNSDEKKTTHVGSIAQYWAGLNDWFCKTDNEGYYTMEIQNAALASAISVARELVKYESKTDKQIRKLKKRISELEDEIETLKKK